MAPSQTPAASSNATELRPLATSLETTIQSLYQLMVCVSRFESPDGVLNNISEYVHSLSALQTALPPSNTTSFPVDVIHYVEDGRNPDIYTREFVELVVRQNQVLNGRKKAYREFRDVLAREIETAFPELGKEVGEVLQKTQG